MIARLMSDAIVLDGPARRSVNVMPPGRACSNGKVEGAHGREVVASDRP